METQFVFPSSSNTDINDLMPCSYLLRIFPSSFLWHGRCKLRIPFSFLVALNSVVNISVVHNLDHLQIHNPIIFIPETFLQSVLRELLDGFQHLLGASLPLRMLFFPPFVRFSNTNWLTALHLNIEIFEKVKVGFHDIKSPVAQSMVAGLRVLQEGVHFQTIIISVASGHLLETGPIGRFLGLMAYCANDV